jgi:hypothetical protein
MAQYRHMWIIVSPFLLKYFTPKRTGGITVFPFIFLAEAGFKSDKVFINHEMIHIRQQAEMLLLIFILWYYTEFLIRILQYQNMQDAYRNISFEREAFARENDLNYLKTRRFWGFLKYLQIRH